MRNITPQVLAYLRLHVTYLAVRDTATEEHIDDLIGELDRLWIGMSEKERGFDSVYGINGLCEVLLDAARYQWIKAQRNLLLGSSNALWYRGGDETEPYSSPFQLSVRATAFHGREHLDGLIDEAMEMYPDDGPART